MNWSPPSQQRPTRLITQVCAAASLGLLVHAAAARPAASLTIAPDQSGLTATYNVTGPIDTTNPFFVSLGSNARSCSTCHLTTEAMSFTPSHAQQLYLQTSGRDPLFASIDGANCADVARADRAGHSLILRNGLIRVGLPMPANAEFSISVVHDPYGCALQVDPKAGVLTVSVYRRPLPAANLSFLSAVMFDGRETVAPLSSPASFLANLRTDLMHQAIDATMGHAQATAPPSDATVQAIVDFELGLFSAQYADREAGGLDQGGAAGGPVNLAAVPYHPGINDSLGADPSGGVFTPVSMLLYQAWAGLPQTSDENTLGARADIAAGEQLFNTLPITITNVRGLNDNAAIGKPTSFVGHCATCHDSPNIGNHSLPLPLDIGTSHTEDPSLETDVQVQAAVGQLSFPDLPVFLILGCPSPFNPGQSASFYTSDPGKALITGKCSDVNRIKGPILRGLAARAPYFHNGAAATLLEAINFYDQRFQMHLTDDQKRQLVAFLNAL